MRGKRLLCGTAAFICAAVLLSMLFRSYAVSERAMARKAVFEALEKLGFTVEEPIHVSTLEESSAADHSALAQSCIIGHSHAAGMQMTLCVEGLDYITEVGMSALGMLTNSEFELPNGAVGGLAYGLSVKQYDRVFVFLGCNDMLGGEAHLTSFSDHMKAILELIRQYQPEAEVCLLSIAPFGESFFNYCRSSYGLTQDIADDYNYTLRALAVEYGADYLDITTNLSNDMGFLAAEYDMGDGLHFNEAGNRVILDTILTHLEE